MFFLLALIFFLYSYIQLVLKRIFLRERLPLDLIILFIYNGGASENDRDEANDFSKKLKALLDSNPGIIEFFLYYVIKTIKLNIIIKAIIKT